MNNVTNTTITNINTKNTPGRFIELDTFLETKYPALPRDKAGNLIFAEVEKEHHGFMKMLERVWGHLDRERLKLYFQQRAYKMYGPQRRKRNNHVLRAAKAEPVRNGSSKYAELFKYLDSVELALDSRGRINWQHALATHPKLVSLAGEHWGADMAKIRVGLSTIQKQRTRVVSHITTEVSHVTHVNDVAHPVDEWVGNNFDAIPRTLKGRLRVREIETKLPELWQIAQSHWPGKSAKQIGWNLTNRIKRVEKKRNALLPVVAAKRHPRKADAIETVVDQSFKFELCPKCFCQITSIEKMTLTKLNDCPRCHFPLAIAEQGVSAALNVARNQQHQYHH